MYRLSMACLVVLSTLSWGCSRGNLAHETAAINSTRHAGHVTSLMFSADGSRLASGGQDGSIKVWDAGAKTLIRTLTGHAGAVSGLVWAGPDRLVSTSEDDSLRLWQLEGPSAEILSDEVSGLALATDSSSGIASVALRGSPGGRVGSWSTRSLQRLTDFETGLAVVHALALSADSREMAVGGRGGISIRDLKSQVVKTIATTSAVQALRSKSGSESGSGESGSGTGPILLNWAAPPTFE